MKGMLEVNHIRKAFGAQEVIKDLSFTIGEHSIYGFIGKNGSGKTTTMKMILGLHTVDGGEIYVNGERVIYGKGKTNSFIGYLPDVPEFYNFMTPEEYLGLCGEISLMDREECRKRTKELLEKVGLGLGRKRIQGFSRGMKQRLGIAQALLNKPKLLICDEPTSALDPEGRKEILDILHSIKGTTTILFSTHILSDVERICDEIGVLHEGRLALSGSLEEIREKHPSKGFEIEFSRVEDTETFLGFKTIERLVNNYQRKSGTKILFESNEEDAVITAMKAMVDNKIEPLSMIKLEPTLEDLFLEVTSK